MASTFIANDQNNFGSIGSSDLVDLVYQCDQMVEFEVAHFFTKVAPKSRHCSFCMNRDIFLISPELNKFFGYFSNKISKNEFQK